MAFDPKQHLDAYIDGELSKADKELFEQALLQDKSLADEVCTLSKIKQEIQLHYRQLSIPKKSAKPEKPNRQYVKSFSYAASLLVAVIIGFWAGHLPPLPSNLSASHYASSTNQHVILHLDSSQNDRGEKLLQEAGLLLAKSEDESGSGPKTIEIVTNDQGIEFFAEDNPHKDEILALLSQYDNVKLIACRRAIERKKAEGKIVKLLPAVESDRLALDVIVEKMQQGWGYKKF